MGPVACGVDGQRSDRNPRDSPLPGLPPSGEEQSKGRLAALVGPGHDLASGTVAWWRRSGPTRAASGARPR
jgi:hypothetical protein